MLINSRIVDIRIELKKDQETFAAILFISPDDLNQIEHNKSSVSDDLFHLICTNLDINAHWLRTGEGPMFNYFPIHLLDKTPLDSSEQDAFIETLQQIPPEERRKLFYYLLGFATGFRMFKIANEKLDSTLTKAESIWLKTGLWNNILVHEHSPLSLSLNEKIKLQKYRALSVNARERIDTLLDLEYAQQNRDLNVNCQQD